jgi:sn-glycerol 3-phosphate transport system substrate-binding protein
MADKQSPSAMTIGTSAALGTVKSVLDGGLIEGLTSADIGVGPMPGPGGAPGVLVGGASLWIVDGHGDEKSAASWDYINYLVSAQSQSTWAAGTGYVPVRGGALDLEPLKTTYATDPRFKVAYDQVNAPADALSAAGPITGPLREIRVVVARAVATILQGGDPQATLSAAAVEANALIADYTSRNS